MGLFANSGSPASEYHTEYFEAENYRHFEAASGQIQRSAEMDKLISQAERAVKDAETRGNRNEQAQAFYDLATAFETACEYEKALANFHRSFELFSELNEQKKMARSLIKMGVISEYLSQYDQALEYFNRALKISEEDGQRAGTASALYYLGYIYDTKGRFDLAAKFYRNSLRIREEINDDLGRAESMLRLGNVNRIQANYDAALDYYQQAKRIFERLNNLQGLGRALQEMGVFYSKIEDYNTALDYYHKALKLETETDNVREIARTHGFMGVVYQKLQKYDEALSHHQKTLELRQRLSDLAGLGATYHNFGIIYFSKNEYELSKQYYEQALEIRSRLGGLYGLAETNSELGRVNIKLKRNDAAIAHLIVSLNIARSENLKELIKSDYELLSAAYQLSNNNEKALEYYKSFAAISDSLHQAKTGKKLAEWIIRYQTEKIERELAQLKKDKIIQENLNYFYMVVSLLVIVIAFINFLFYRHKRKSNQFWQTVLNSLSHPFYVFNVHDGAIKLANRFGWQNFDQNAPGTGKPLLGQSFLLEQIRTSKQAQSAEHQFTDSNGNTRYLEISGFPIFDDNGQIAQVIEYSIDITERKKAERELLEKSVALKASRDEYERVLSSIPDAVWSAVIDSDGNVFDSFYSPAIEKITGYSAASFDGAKNVWASVVHPDDLWKLRNRNSLILHDGAAVSEMDYRIVRRDGQVRFVKSSVTMTDLGNDRFRADGILTDITGKKQAEDMLAAEKERLAVTLSSIAEGVITTDTDGRVQYLNANAEKLTGWTSSEAIGVPIELVFHIVNAKTQQVRENPVLRTLNAQMNIDFEEETILEAKDSLSKQIAYSGAPIRTGDGNIIGVVIVFRDISERRHLEEELLKIRKLESVGILAGGIAHDFNNILTAILGNISLAKMYVSGDSKAFSRLSEAEKASFRAKELTQQLLTFSRGGAPLKKAASITELLQEAVNFTLLGSSLRCEFEFAPDLCLAEMDEGQISQVVYNLAINAKQAMPNGGLLKVTAKNYDVDESSRLPLKAGKYLNIEISDQGVGIPEEHLQKIFDPYFTTKQEGSGLGLAISFSIIKKHDGYITVRSQPGKGSTFTLYLPATDLSVPQQEQEAQSACQFRGSALLMDDEADIREVAGEMLRFLGLNVSFARDGYEALQLYRQALSSGAKFDAVILDLTIPGGMGGKDAVQELRRIDPGVKAIVSSGYSTDLIMANYEEYGFDGCMAKPYKLNEMSEALQKVLPAL